MPIAVPKDYQYSYIPETKEELDWADLPTVDLSKYDQGEEAKKELAHTLLEAFNVYGFFYLINFGFTDKEVSRQFGIGTEFYATPLEDRMKSRSRVEQGNSNGYRPAGLRSTGKDGLTDKVQEYNVPVQEDALLTHPQVIQEALPEIQDFQHRLHDNVLKKLYDLIAIALEVPPETFDKVHEYRGDETSRGATGILRYMKYSPYDESEIARLNKPLLAGGHTDSCAMTLLFRQPIAALQIKVPGTGEWKWAKPMDGSATVNAGDVLSILTGGYIKSTIHRVNIPPKDQRMYERLGVIYFSRPPIDLVLKTVDSPVLKAAGCDKNYFELAGNPSPTAGDYQIQKELWQRHGVNAREHIKGFQGGNRYD